MNAHDILMYGHRWVHGHLDGLKPEEWLTPNVCGMWSVKDIVAHLTSFECVLIDVFSSFTAPGQPTPTLDQMNAMDGDRFNEVQVGKRQNESPESVLQEYDEAYQQVMRLLERVPPEKLAQPGTIRWYGKEYSLDDLIVYQYYGHKREHCAQIAVYRDGLG